jgi:hypothetical protein
MLLDRSPTASSGLHKNTALEKDKGATWHFALWGFSVGFKGHDKPYPAWYPYAFVCGIAAVATALYVLI